MLCLCVGFPRGFDFFNVWWRLGCAHCIFSIGIVLCGFIVCRILVNILLGFHQVVSSAINWDLYSIYIGILACVCFPLYIHPYGKNISVFVFIVVVARNIWIIRRESLWIVSWCFGLVIFLLVSVMLLFVWLWFQRAWFCYGTAWRYCWNNLRERDLNI